MTGSPKVFISHASEDKDRFVTKFAQRLRANGIDAWLDKWEMLPGDSLVAKIFEGIQQAQAVIVVLSKNSVSKPWVGEEIDAAFVRRVNGSSKLIPVIIDDCRIPECLRSTVYQRIANLDDFESASQNIVRAVFGNIERPPIGSAPFFLQNSIAIGSLNSLEIGILCSLCDYCISQNIERVDGPDLLKLFEALKIDEEHACVCLEILQNRGYVELLKIQGINIARAEPTIFGFHEYLHSTRIEYNTMLKRVALLVVNEHHMDGTKLCHCAGLPPLITSRIVQYFERKGWMQVTNSEVCGLSGFIIYRVSPELKRWLQDQ